VPPLANVCDHFYKLTAERVLKDFEKSFENRSVFNAVRPIAKTLWLTFWAALCEKNCKRDSVNCVCVSARIDAAV